MNKKTIAILAEIIPVVSAVAAYLLIISNYDSEPIRWVILITTLLAFLGFVFFFVGRRLARGDLAVRILGILDWLATFCVIGFYVLAFISVAL